MPGCHDHLILSAAGCHCHLLAWLPPEHCILLQRRPCKAHTTRRRHVNIKLYAAGRYPPTQCCHVNARPQEDFDDLIANDADAEHAARGDHGNYQRVTELRR